MSWQTIKNDFQRHRASDNYLGFLALLNYRFGNWADSVRLKPLRWILLKFYMIGIITCEALGGVHLGRATKLGDDFHIIHCGNININDNATIGDRVGIMQGVTIGTNVGEGVPVIGDDVFIGANASVLGDITVGNGARIAANSLVITNVPDGHLAIGVPAKVLPQINFGEEAEDG